MSYILLIDDDTDEFVLMKDVFKNLGLQYELLCYSDAEAAFRFLKQTEEQPFLIIADINMPRLNGIEFKRHIDSDGELFEKAIPFIFLSTSATPDAVREAYLLHSQGFFEKPHSMEDLCDLIKNIVNYWERCIHPKVFE